MQALIPTQQMLPRHTWRVVVALLMALVLLIAGTAVAHAAPAGKLPAVVYTQIGCVGLFSQPSANSTLLASAIPGTGLRVTGLSSDGQWYHALFLGQMPVWVLATDVATSYQTAYSENDSCPFNDVPTRVPNPVSATSNAFLLHANGIITQYTGLRSAASPSARVTAEILPGEHAYVTQWAADGNGDVWYLAHVQGTLGWVWAYALLFDGPDPATAQLPNGAPVWSVVTGKALWFTDYLPHHTDIHALVAAAKALGVTHIYPRVAETSYGFYEQNSLARLLPVAHAAGIKVIAWVFPYLRNVGADLIMSQQVVNYRTARGDHADGIIADIEERTDAPAVYAYGQVLRQMVGPTVPLIISTFNPRARASYPFPEAAASFNVISPQDYWHNNQNGTFDASSARQLLMISVTTIRAELGGKNFPIEEDGQMYDMFTYGEPGGSQPSAAEITGDMQAAKDLGCTGISFFDWRTASPDELDAFKAFTW
jgi:hypothetical protein